MNQLKIGIILSYVLLVISTLSGILYTPFLIRKLGQEEYGLFSLASSVIAYLLLFDFGLGSAVTRFTAKFRAENKICEQYEMFGMFFILYTIVAIVVGICGFMIICNADAVLDCSKMTSEQVSRMKVILYILTANLCVTFPFSVFSAIITAYERFFFIKSLGVIRILLQIAVMIPLLIWGYKAVALAVTMTIFNAVTLIFNALYCFFRLKIKVYFGNMDFSLLKDISGYSFYIFLNAVMDNIYWSSGQFILSYTGGLQQTAIYAAAIRLVMFYISLSVTFSSVLLPEITRMSVTDSDMHNISKLFVKVGRLQFFIIGTVAAGFLIFGQQFILLWAGDEYQHAYWVCVILMLSLLVPLIQNTAIEVLKAKKRLVFRSVLYILLSLAGLFISYFFAVRMGVIGCAIGTGLSLLLGNGVIINIYYWKFIKLDIPLFWRQLTPLVSAVTVVTAVFLIFNKYIYSPDITGYGIEVILFCFVMTMVYWLFCMNTSEKEICRSMLKKSWMLRRRPEHA